MKLLFPTENNFRITQDYGPSDLMINGVYVYSDHFHHGTDIGCPINTPIRSTLLGEVIYAQYDDSFGNNIIVRDKNGITCRDGHLNKIDVTVGQSVNIGDIIGLSGNTGKWTTGAHCHWEMRDKDGNSFNGMDFVVYNFEDIKTMFTQTQIDQGYLSILRRHADPEGMKAYLKYTKSYSDFLLELAESEEHRQIMTDAIKYRTGQTDKYEEVKDKLYKKL